MEGVILVDRRCLCDVANCLLGVCLGFGDVGLSAVGAMVNDVDGVEAEVELECMDRFVIVEFVEDVGVIGDVGECKGDPFVPLCPFLSNISAYSFSRCVQYL